MQNKFILEGRGENQPEPYIQQSSLKPTDSNYSPTGFEQFTIHISTCCFCNTWKRNNKTGAIGQSRLTFPSNRASLISFSLGNYNSDVKGYFWQRTPRLPK